MKERLARWPAFAVLFRVLDRYRLVTALIPLVAGVAGLGVVYRAMRGPDGS